MANEIPKHIIDAVSGLLEPYGVNFSSLLKDETKYITARQASVYCGLSEKTIRRKALSGDIASIRSGKAVNSRVLIVRADLDNWLEGFSSQANHKTA